MNRLYKELLKEDKSKNNKLIRYWKSKTGYKGVRRTVVYRQILNACGNEYNTNKCCYK